MRVAYVSVSGHLGGAERSLLEVLAVAHSEPSWTRVLLVPEDGPLAARARTMGATVQVLPFPPPLARFGDFPPDRRSPRQTMTAARRLGALVAAGAAVPAYVRALRKALAACCPDVVHANGLKTSLASAWARPAGSKVVWHVHDYVSSRPLTSRLLRRSAHRAHLALAVSRSVAADVRAVCGERLRVVPLHNTVDLETFAPHGPAADLDVLAGMRAAPPGTVRAGLVATMAHWKGHETFLEALAQLPAGAPVRGYVVGGPIYRTGGSQHALDTLRVRAERLGLGGRVGFTGFVERPADVMRALDIVVHASTRPEPFGLVVAEGMACGRAVIAADAGGVPEFVVPGADALLHPPGHAARLAACIAALAADPALRARLGAAARAAAETRFARHRLASEVRSAYESLAA